MHWQVRSCTALITTKYILCLPERDPDQTAHRSCTAPIPTNYTLCLPERDPDQTAHGLLRLLSILDRSYKSHKLGNFRPDCTTQRSLFGTSEITRVTCRIGSNQLRYHMQNWFKLRTIIIQLMFCRFPFQFPSHFYNLINNSVS